MVEKGFVLFCLVWEFPWLLCYVYDQLVSLPFFDQGALGAYHTELSIQFMWRMGKGAPEP